MTYSNSRIKKKQLDIDDLTHTAIQGANGLRLAAGAGKQIGNGVRQAGWTGALIGHALKRPGEYKPSDEVKDATQKVEDHIASKPGEYESQYNDRLQEILNEYENKPDFSYDFNADPLYQQYKDKYTQQGKLAMMDTMANAATLSGGYGSSYASTAGNQAYQASLQNVNDIIPELYDRAYGQYRDDKADMIQHMQVLQSLDKDDYAKYQDTLAEYHKTLDFLNNEKWNMTQFEYNQYLDQLQRYQDEMNYITGRVDAAQGQANWQSEQNRQIAQDIINQHNVHQQFEHQKEQDDIHNQQWQDQFDYGKEQDAIHNQQWQDQFDYGKERDQVADSHWQSEFDYGKQRDQVADSHWQSEFDHRKAQDNIHNNQWQQEMAHRKAQDAYNNQMRQKELSAKNSAKNTNSYSKSSGASPSKSQSNKPHTTSKETQNFIKKHEQEFSLYNAGWASDEDMAKAMYNAYASGEISKDTYMEIMRELRL